MFVNAGCSRTVLKEVTTRHRELAGTMKELTERHGRLDAFVTDIAEGTVRLLCTAEAHEERIRRLEGD
jgi:t-SNARE complex subunit (syntaxin)